MERGRNGEEHNRQHISVIAAPVSSFMCREDSPPLWFPPFYYHLPRFFMDAASDWEEFYFFFARHRRRHLLSWEPRRTFHRDCPFPLFTRTEG